MDIIILCLCIFIVVFVVLLAFVIWSKFNDDKQEREELSYLSKCYDGPTGEPLWQGKLPSRVDDYQEPRYVYENLTESCDYLPENGRIIGYRISPELVIHSTIHPSLKPTQLSSYIGRYGGKLLNPDEWHLLLDNLMKISILREKSGDEPLDVDYFWALSEQNLLIRIDPLSGLYEEISGVMYIWCALILKR